MRYKKATLLANLCIILLASVFLYMANHFSESVVEMTSGPEYFPNILCVLLIITSVISTITTFRGSDDHLVIIDKAKNVLFVIGCTIIFIVLWKVFNMFFVTSFFVIAVLLYFLNPKANGLKKVLQSVFTSGCMQLFVYIVFEKLMYFRF